MHLVDFRKLFSSYKENNSWKVILRISGEKIGTGINFVRYISFVIVPLQINRLAKHR